MLTNSSSSLSKPVGPIEKYDVRFTKYYLKELYTKVKVKKKVGSWQLQWAARRNKNLHLRSTKLIRKIRNKIRNS